ncbi:MAG: ice-binding family protein, partial [Candidatus Methanoperedens sp.]|nr:ice-binding family protein [Candidatus Methanoperedens sp.]
TMTAAISDMETAYTDAAGRTNPTDTELYAGDITGKTITPGLYKWGTGVLISAGGVTLSGGANDIWIFQIAQDLTVDNGAIVTLSGGAQAKNIFWQVAGQTTLGTTANFKGIILSKTLISMNTGATLNGRALAQTAVTLDANAITAPSSSVSPTPTATKTSSGSGSGTVTATTAKPTVTATQTPASSNTPTVTSTTTGAATVTTAKPAGTGTPAPATSKPAPGFELVFVAAALYSVYMFSRNRR